ncbi:hypothetical protein DB345_05120 [Spartobacteria bacterium LR76]|nr:hypothetical protein DB345_05120 [Spartobacteria bacterium LR76]
MIVKKKKHIENNTLQMRSVYTVGQLAAHWGVSTKSVYRLIKRGIIRPCVVLRKYLITEDEAARVLQESI